MALGNDRLVNFAGGDATLNGDAGQRRARRCRRRQRPERRWPVDDVASGQLGGLTVGAGSGNDVVDVYGAASTAADTVTCGPGWDIVWANGADAVARRL